MLVCRDRKLNNAEFVRIVKNDNVTNVNAFEVLALFLYERESTYHCLPRDWIDKAIDDPSKGLCDHIDSANDGRVAIHTELPSSTGRFHCRNSERGITSIRQV